MLSIYLVFETWEEEKKQTKFTRDLIYRVANNKKQITIFNFLSLSHISKQPNRIQPKKNGSKTLNKPMIQGQWSLLNRSIVTNETFFYHTERKKKTLNSILTNLHSKL
jgi:hypothetical protein